jgi:hypothetical protein
MTAAVHLNRYRHYDFLSPALTPGLSIKNSKLFVLVKPDARLRASG